MCSTGWFKQNCFRSQCWPNVYPVGPTITIAKTLNPETAVPLTIFNCFVSFSLIYMSYIEHHNLMGHGSKTYISHTTVQSENILNTIMQFDYHLQAAESRVFNSWFTSGKISNILSVWFSWLSCNSKLLGDWFTGRGLCWEGTSLEFWRLWH